MSRTRLLLLSALLLAGLLYTIYAMSQRVTAYNAQHPPTQWVFTDPIKPREFTFAGRAVKFTDTTADDGSEVVVVRYGDAELKLAATLKPGDARLPGLIRHQDWMKVLRFADFGRSSFKEFQDKLEEGTDRLVIVVRRPLTAPDPRTGDVWQRDWMFDFHELLKDGTIKTEGLKFPKTKGDRTPMSNELKRGSWQMIAALQLMPKIPPDSLNVGRPTAAFQGDAVKSMGWTLPAGAALTLGLLATLSLAAAPRRQKSSEIR